MPSCLHRLGSEVGRRSSPPHDLPIVGDDIKSHVGATITHRVLAKLFENRGVRLERTYQLNFGGNMDFRNMLERSRLHSKKISKTQATTSQIPLSCATPTYTSDPATTFPFLPAASTRIR
jgi:myo-inositol-1-phosphate synthase